MLIKGLGLSQNIQVSWATLYLGLLELFPIFNRQDL